MEVFDFVDVYRTSGRGGECNSVSQCGCSQCNTVAQCGCSPCQVNDTAGCGCS